MELLLIAAAAFLAFSNGANDNFKGFATVWGSQTLSYRQALTFATIATVLGSLVSLVLAQSLVQHFSGKGLVPDDIAGSSSFIFSVALGAATTVMIATRVGLPISTTHAIIGGLLGAGLAHGDGAVNPQSLVSTLLLPLLISPFVAAALGALAYRYARRRDVSRDCACLEPGVLAADLATGSGVAVARNAGTMRVIVDTDAQCERLPQAATRLSISSALDRVHTFSAASICFARGVNDTPKLTALLVAAAAFEAQGAILTIAVLMACGGLMFSHGVARTMSQRVAAIDRAQGLSANLISAGLILFASKLGLPVSTTHVTVGSIAGAGMGARTLDWRALSTVLLSWVATLPIAALAGYAFASIA